MKSSRPPGHAPAVDPVVATDESGPGAAATPLFVDLDGTLVATNTLLECLLLRLRHRPLDLLKLPLWLWRGRAYVKARLAEDDRLEVGRLPYRGDLCDQLRRVHAEGRRVYLATAADQRIAHRIARHLGFFDAVLASDGQRNLRAREKLAAIRDVAARDFDYAGNARDDLVIWRAARSAIVVGARSGLVRRVARLGRPAQIMPATASPWREIVRALRVHQWLKNLLVFVPLLTSFRFTDPGVLTHSLVAFFAFCFCASSIYIVNDLLDLEADRAHPRKRFRPFAGGTLSIPVGLLVAASGMGLGLGLAGWDSQHLLAIMLVYVATSTAYSIHLKTRVLADVIVLAILYTLRIFAGAAGTGIPLSVWLVAFSVLVFLSLGLVKRCSELMLLQREGRQVIRGRDYVLDDLKIFWPMGVATSVGAVLLFAFFIHFGGVQAHYRTPALLWIVAVGLFYWLSRMWIKTARGEMTDDPLVFALRDAGSRTVIAGMILVTVAARYAPLAWP